MIVMEVLCLIAVPYSKCLCRQIALSIHLVRTEDLFLFVPELAILIWLISGHAVNLMLAIYTAS